MIEPDSSLSGEESISVSQGSKDAPRRVRPATISGTVFQSLSQVHEGRLLIPLICVGHVFKLVNEIFNVSFSIELWRLEVLSPLGWLLS